MAFPYVAKNVGLGRFVKLPRATRALFPSRQQTTTRDAGDRNGKSVERSIVGPVPGPTAASLDTSYSVAHHVTGRLRLYIPRLAYDADFAQRLATIASELAGVTRVRATRHGRSLVVDYVPNIASTPTISRGDSILADLARCIQQASANDDERGLIEARENREVRIPPADAPIRYGARLSLPVLGLGLSVGAAAGLGIPGLLIGGAVLASATPIFRRTVQGIKDEKRLTVDFLDSTAIVLLTAQASFVAPAVIVAVIEGSEITRDWTARRSVQAELNLLEATHKSVIVERGGRQETVNIDAILPGDVITTYPGDEIAVDGLVVGGTALVDQRQLTGVSELVDREQGDEVYASSLVTDGYLRILARQTGNDTHIARVHAEIASLSHQDTRISNHARKLGNGAVVPTLLVGGAVYATSGSLARASGIVSLDLGTGMRVSAPIAVLAAQNNAASQGIVIRSGQALEALAQIDTVVFDKTATLTQGQMAIVNVEVRDPTVDPRQLLALAASAEQELNHPVAEAIVARARLEDVQIMPCTSWEYAAGLGVIATIEGQVVHVGNRAMMQSTGIDDAALADTSPAQQVTTEVYVARAGKLIGRIDCADPVRPESAEVIARLQQLGIHAHLFSGDRYPVSRAVALDLGIESDHIYAEILPQSKVDVVRSLQAKGKTVAVVGDGVNDVVAMATADVSIALGGATDLARATADILLVDDDLRDLIVAHDIARHATGIIRQNRALIVVPNVGAIAYGAFFALGPVAGVVINNGTALVAAMNSLRPARRSGKVVNGTSVAAHSKSNDLGE